MFWMVLIAALSGGEPATVPQFEDCRAEAEQLLAEFGVAPNDVRGIQSMPIRRRTLREDDRIVGFNVWVRQYSCEGSVNLRFSRYCRLRTTHATGDCQVPGR